MRERLPDVVAAKSLTPSKTQRVMARYTKYQNNNRMSKAYGKWYARAQVVDVVSTDELAEEIQRNASVKHSDVLAVLKEMSECIQRELANGKRVVINGIGSFKPTLTSKGELTPEEVTAQSVTNTRVLFMPEIHKDSSGHFVKALISKLAWREAVAYDKPVSEAEPEPEPEP